MDRHLSAAHESHDELLLARLYGGDLQGRELERARDLAASCEECAAVLADFGTIAAAAAALPVPPRPRDFTIGEAKARQLRRRRWYVRPFGVGAVIRGLGPVRSLGASMTAVGIAGVLAIGAVSFLAPHDQGTTTYSMADTRTQGGPGSGGYGYEPIPTQDSKGLLPGDSAAPPREGNESTSAPELAVGSGKPATAETAKPAAAETSSGAAALDGNGAAGHDTNGAPSKGPAGAPDYGWLWLIGSGMLAASGFVLLLAPTLRKLRSGGRRS